jgi:hypothetical protein
LSLIRALLVTFVCACAAPAIHAASYSADAVKAAYLFRFASYVEWPGDRTGDAPFVFGVYGADDVAVHLERLTTGMSLRGRPAEVRRIRSAADLKGVQILYVGPLVFRGSRPLRAAAAGRPILLVTDHGDGLEGSAVINFIEVNRNLRFEISLDAANRCGLRIDSALLSVAARVDKRSKQ